MTSIDSQFFKQFDWVMLMLVVLVSAMALTNLYSSSYAGGDVGASSLFLKQLVFFCAGLGLILALQLVEYQHIAKAGWILYVIILLLLIYTRIFMDSVAGAQRWIDLGFFNLQPSEPAKLVMILVLTCCYATGPSVSGGYRLRDMIRPMILVLPPFGLILIQPDLGTALIVAVVFISMTLFVRLRWLTLSTLAGLAISCVFIGWKFLLKPYQRKRIETFLNPEADPANHGYQILQSKIAVGSGKLFGKGFMEGTQGHLHFLPERHTDFAFAVWGEEWGFAGSLFFLACYFFMMGWGAYVAMTARDRLGAIMAFGCVALIFWQAVINLLMILGFLPVVGVPLPLFSYGGSSMLTNMAAIGILMNIRMQSNAINYNRGVR